MNKQPTSSTSGVTTATQPARPQWWTDKHNSTWDRVKEALRRDWEQTRSDFSSEDGTDLNQDIGDTIKQAAGSAPIPPPTVQTRPDDPRDAAKRAEEDIKARGKAQGKAVSAQTDAAVEQVRAQGRIAHEQQVASEKIAHEQRKLGEVEAEAREKTAKAQRDGREKVAKQYEKIAEARADASRKVAEIRRDVSEKVADAQKRMGEKFADWNRVEPAVRYGYGARAQYADAPGWDEAEERLEREWTQLRGNASWNDARPHIRRGWDAATRNSLV